MPKPKQHPEKADHHRAFLATVTDDQFHDWAAVVAFCTAVERVETLRAFDGERGAAPSDRQNLLQAPL